MLKVLVADDHEVVRTAIQVLLELHGIAVVTAATPADVLRLLESEDIGCVVQDMNFDQRHTDGEDGVALFHAIRKSDPDMPVILMTAWASLETAVELTRAGAADYVAKPWKDEKLLRSVQTLLRVRELERRHAQDATRSVRARRQLEQRYDLRGIVFASPAMQELLRLAVHVAPSDAPVLITGPNGSGKERLAEILQANSRRQDKPFVTINAGGLPDELLEAELFGAEAGAFTGAAKLRIGRFEAAHNGTLFLDEVGNLSAAGQVKLLRVLQTGEFQRLGSNNTLRTDVRLISATNADLSKDIAAGRFREDLYFRLNVIELRVPPLAERLEDIRPLAEHFLARFSDRLRHLTDQAVAALESYQWPGNVRELQNRMQRASLVVDGEVIDARDLDLAPAPPATQPIEPPAQALDREDIEEALAHANGVVARAASAVGLSRQAFYRRMEAFGISPDRHRS